MIRLPKPYLSYSAASLWKQNKELFRKRYYEGEKLAETGPMIFGKTIAKVLESRDYSKYPELEKVPYYPVSEHPLNVKIGEVKVLGYLDLYEPKTFTFGEVKTGSVSKTKGPPWTQEKVERHDQLNWYSLMIETLYGKVNDETKLIWVETKFNIQFEKLGSRVMECEGTDLSLTGRVEVFNRIIDKSQREQTKEEIQLIAKEISEDYIAWLSSR